jgi:hypothetical protein
VKQNDDGSETSRSKIRLDLTIRGEQDILFAWKMSKHGVTWPRGHESTSDTPGKTANPPRGQTQHRIL